MMNGAIRCPQCSFEFEPSDAVSKQLRRELEAEYKAASFKQEQELASREAELRKREVVIAQAKAGIEDEVQLKLSRQREQLLQEAKGKAQAELTLQLSDFQNQLAETKQKLEASQKAEIELRKSRRELEDEKRELEVTVNRRLDDERAKIRELARKEEGEIRQLKEAEKDKLIEDMKRQINDLKRKSEQGSQQVQGEVLETEIEELLRSAFPHDIIEAVPKGVHGGDVLQIVHNGIPGECGRILWESKRTKSWSDGWLPKLRDDQRAAKAQFAVLASTELPKGCSTFTFVEGIWVTNRACLLGVAMALRAGLIDVSKAKRSENGRQGKMELIYNYLAGPEFRHRVDGIVEAFVALKSDLEAEKRAMMRIWAKREKQIDRALTSAVGMHGDLSGMIGASLPTIESLELLAIAGPERSDESVDA